jgi:hypothetical protein
MVTDWRKTLPLVDKALTCVEALGPQTIENFRLPIYRCSNPSAEVLCKSCAETLDARWKEVLKDFEPTEY